MISHRTRVPGGTKEVRLRCRMCGGRMRSRGLLSSLAGTLIQPAECRATNARLKPCAISFRLAEASMHQPKMQAMRGIVQPFLFTQIIPTRSPRSLSAMPNIEMDNGSGLWQIRQDQKSAFPRRWSVYPFPFIINRPSPDPSCTITHSILETTSWTRPI